MIASHRARTVGSSRADTTGMGDMLADGSVPWTGANVPDLDDSLNYGAVALAYATGFVNNIRPSTGNDLNLRRASGGLILTVRNSDGQISIMTDFRPGVDDDIDLGLDTFAFKSLTAHQARFREQASAIADVAGIGQFWVRDDVPNVPMFTDDAGTDFVLNAAPSGIVTTDGLTPMTGTWAFGGQIILGMGTIVPDSTAKDLGSGPNRWNNIFALDLRGPSSQKRINLATGLTSLNIDANDIDTAIKGNADAVLLTTDAALNRAGVGVALNAHAAKLDVDQNDVAGAVPVLRLKQTDVSEPMILLDCTVGVGNGIEAVGAKTLTVTHFGQVEIAGVGVRYIQLGTIA